MTGTGSLDARPFGRMLDAMPVPVWVAGADGARTMFDRAWTTFTGRTEAEELGWGWTEGA